MKKQIIYALLFLILLISLSAGKLFGQKADTTRIIKHRGGFLFSLSFINSPFYQSNTIAPFNPGINSNPYFSFQSGLMCTLRMGHDTGPSISLGFLIDYKRNNIFYVESSGSSPLNYYYSSGESTYNFLYVPLQLNLYIKRFYISGGLMIRFPVLSSDNYNAEDYSYNPRSALQIGVGRIIPISNTHLSLQIEPFIIFAKDYNQDADITTSVNHTCVDETISSGTMIGIYLKLTQKIIKF